MAKRVLPRLQRRRKSRTGSRLRGAAALLALGAMVMPNLLGLPIRKLIAAAAELPDALSLLAARSPDGRADGNLRTSKPRRMPLVATGGPSRALGAPFVPEERVLAGVRTRAPEFPAPDTGGGPDADLAQNNMPTIEGIPEDFAPFMGPRLGGGSGGFVPTNSFLDAIPPVPPEFPELPLIPPGPPAPPSPPPPPAPVLAIPEPATWFSIMLGFFALGGALRRRRASTRPA